MDERSYRKLKVWQRSMDLMVEVYKLTDHLPTSERFGLAAQARGAAVSVPSNLAEGYGRMHRGDYCRHVSIARGSLMELETQLIAMVRLGFLTREVVAPVWQTAQEVGRMLTELHRSLQRTPSNPALTDSQQP
jgi:four helix bundle protein